MRAALDLIAQKGPAGFTFAEAARWAGVSPAAPYRHFRDRDDLLADVARRGFELFAAALTRRLGRRAAGSVTRLRAARQGLSGISRAASRPTIRRCSRPEFRSIPIPELREAGDRAFAVLRNGRRALIARDAARDAPAGADDGAAHLVAVARHRVAVRRAAMRGGGAANGAGGPTGSGVLIYLRGLGRAPRSPGRAEPRVVAPRLTAGALAYVNVINIHTARIERCQSRKSSTNSAGRPGSR